MEYLSDYCSVSTNTAHETAHGQHVARVTSGQRYYILPKCAEFKHILVSDIRCLTFLYLSDAQCTSEVNTMLTIVVLKIKN